MKYYKSFTWEEFQKYIMQIYSLVELPVNDNKNSITLQMLFLYSLEHKQKWKVEKNQFLFFCMKVITTLFWALHKDGSI